MTVREIQGHLLELYGTEVSPDLISRVTDAILDEVREWQNRPLDAVYPVVFSTRNGSRSATTGRHSQHHGNVDYRSVRTFAVKPRAFGAPLCGVGA
jgi:hypothetical protein